MANYSYYGDKLYIGDIPLNEDDVYFFYDEDKDIVLLDNVYNREDDEGVMCYKLINAQEGKLIYFPYGTDFALIKNESFYPLKVTRKWYDRSDAFNILSFSLCVFVGTVWILNIFTSIFKKGGLLGGLL